MTWNKNKLANDLIKMSDDTIKDIINKQEIDMDPIKPVETKDNINPSHYKQYPIEVIDMMSAIWGFARTRDYCIMTAFKYRMRLGLKDNAPINEDMAKEKWYLTMAEELDRKAKGMLNVESTAKA